MSILHKLEQTSFKSIIAISLLLGLALAIPVVVWLNQQQTKLASKAYFEKPSPRSPIVKYGLPSESEPEITLVWPFLGKIGDAVLIEGVNFGENPADKKLKLGNVLVPEEKILRWTDNLIEFMVPDLASSSLINFEVVGKGASWPYLFTVYDLDTKIQVTESNDIVKVLNAPLGGKVQIIYQDGSTLESQAFDGFSVASDKTIMDVIVFNRSNSPVPFFVEPQEFGF